MIRQSGRQGNPSEERDAFQELRRRAEQHLQVLEKALSQQPPQHFAAGQIWLTRQDLRTPSGTLHVPRGYFVLLLSAPWRVPGSDAIVADAAMIHPESFNATDADLLLPDAIPVVGGGMVSLWNRGPILTENLEYHAGHLEKALLRQCEVILRRMQRKQVRGFAELPVGPPPLSSADVRLEFQQEVLRQTSTLWHPELPVAGQRVSAPTASYIPHATGGFLDEVRKAIRVFHEKGARPALGADLAFQSGVAMSAPGGSRYPARVSRDFILPELPDVGGMLLFEKGVLQIILKGDVSTASLTMRYLPDHGDRSRPVSVASYPGINGSRDRDRTILTVPQEYLQHFLKGDATLRIVSTGRTATTSVRQIS